MRKRRFGVVALVAAVAAVFVPVQGSAAPPPQDVSKGTAVIASLAVHVAPGLGVPVPPSWATGQP
jgi:hypothetical protein